MQREEEGGLGVIETASNTYSLTRRIGDGDVARIYLGETRGGKVTQVAIKVTKSSKDNSLILNEQGVLSSVAHPFLPKILDRFSTVDDRYATVFEYIGGLDLEEIRAKPRHKKGIDPHFHVGWFLEKGLGVFGELHSKLVVHGNIQPKHIILTTDHKVVPLDFCWARRNPTEWDRIKIYTDHFSAPEVKRRAPPLPGMDIYSLGKCAVYLLGGDPSDGRMPSSVDARIQAFIEAMIEPNYLKRPNDAWKLAREILALRRKVYGPPRWVELEF